MSKRGFTQEELEAIKRASEALERVGKQLAESAESAVATVHGALIMVTEALQAQNSGPEDSSK